MTCALFVGYTSVTFVLYFCPASAEIYDASETFESKVVQLNQQLVEMSLQLAQARKNETASSTTIQTLKDSLQAARTAGEEKARSLAQLQASLKMVSEEKAALSREVERVAVEKGETERKVGLSELKLEEMAVEQGRWEEEKAGLSLHIAELEASLNSVRENMKTQCESAELVHAESTHSPPSSWQEEKSSLTAKVVFLQGERAQLASTLEQEKARQVQQEAELSRVVEEARIDGAAESEILQARISELTMENVTALAELSALRKQVGAKKGTTKLTSLRAQLHNTQAELTSLKGQLEEEKASACDRLGSLQEQLEEERSSAQAELASLREQLKEQKADAQDKLAPLKEQLEGAQDELALLREQLEGAQAELALHREQLEGEKLTAQDQLALLQQQVEGEKLTAQDKLASLREQMDGEKANARVELTSLREQLEKAREETAKDADQQLATLNQELEARCV